MIYRILVELAVIAHFAFVLFIIFGGALGVRWRLAVLLHLPALMYGLFNELLNIHCPLAPFENWLREMSAERGFANGVIEQYLTILIYPPNWDQNLGNLLALVLLLFNVAVYAVIVMRWRHQLV